MSRNRTPFQRREDGLVEYDKLPYLGLNRLEERRLLADLVTLALPENDRMNAASGLATADILAAENRNMESTSEVSKVYSRGVKRLTELSS